MIRRRSGRPLGTIALQTLQFAADRGVTVLEVARELQLSRAHASDTLYELRSRGYLQVVDVRAEAGARKPLPVVRATAAEPSAAAPGILVLTWPPRS